MKVADAAKVVIDDWSIDAGRELPAAVFHVSKHDNPCPIGRVTGPVSTTMVTNEKEAKTATNEK